MNKKQIVSFTLLLIALTNITSTNCSRSGLGGFLGAGLGATFGGAAGGGRGAAAGAALGAVTGSVIGAAADRKAAEEYYPPPGYADTDNSHLQADIAALEARLDAQEEEITRLSKENQQLLRQQGNDQRTIEKLREGKRRAMRKRR